MVALSQPGQIATSVAGEISREKWLQASLAQLDALSDYSSANTDSYYFTFFFAYYFGGFLLRGFLAQEGCRNG